MQVCGSVQVAWCCKKLQHQCNTTIGAGKWHNKVCPSRCAADQMASGEEKGPEGTCEEEVSAWQCHENVV